MTKPTIPELPSLSNKTTFLTLAQAFFVWLTTTFIDWIDSIATAMNFNSTNDTSATSLLIGTGSKSLTVSPNKSFVGGMYVVIADTAAPSTNSMVAQVTSYNSTTGALVVNAVNTTGSGTKTAWTISQTAKPFITGSLTAADVAAGTFGTGVLLPSGQLTGTVAIANGGTGATTASTALTALGGASLTALASDTGASLIGFKQSGAGAVSRTLDAKSKESVSVKDFGAVGDGVTVDSSAFQLALNYAATNNKTLELVSGETYNCTGSTLNVACNIFGNGATIKGYLSVTTDDLTLKDFELIGTNPSIALYLAGSTTAPTRWYRLKLLNIKITFAAGVATANSFGLYASNIDFLEVRGCNILYGIQLIGCTEYMIDGNIIDGDNFSNENELIHASLLSYGHIVNNTFRNSLDNYIDLYSSGARTIISNNRFLSCKTRQGAAIEIKVTLTDDANSSSDTNGWVEQIIIDGNYFYDTRAFAVQATQIIAVFYLDSRAAPSYSVAETPRNILITNNVFDGFDATLHGASYFSPIYFYDVTSAIVKGNIFRNMALGTSSDMSSCVWVEKCRDINIEGNRMSIKNGTGVSLHDACENITVANNHMLDDLNKTHTLSYGIRITKEGSRPAPIITNSNFHGNIVKANISAFRHIYSAGGQLDRCLIQNNIFQQECSMQLIQKCTISGNKFEVTSTRNTGCEIGIGSAISAHNIVVNNTIVSPSGTPKTGFSITRFRGGQVSANIIHTATYGILFAGTSTAGELDYINVKDNFSISQTQANFPHYSGMNAADTALLQAANNQKIT